MRKIAVALSAIALAAAGAVYATSQRVVPADVFQTNVTGNHVDVDAPGVSSTYSLHLPTSQASAAGQCPVNDGSGNMTWSWVRILDQGGGNGVLRGAGGVSALDMSPLYIRDVSGSTLYSRFGLTGGFRVGSSITGSDPVDGQVEVADRVGINTTAPSERLHVVDGNLLLGNTGTSSASGNPGFVEIDDGVASGNVKLTVPTTVPTPYTITVPPNPGTSGQFLQTDGAGTTSWATVSTTPNPMTTTGDMIYSSDNAGTPARLLIGSSAQVIHGGTIPSWSSVSLTADVTGTLPVSNGGTGDTSFTSNAVVIGNATSQLAVVTNNATATNKFLTQSNSNPPAWSTLVSGDIPNNAANTTGTASNVTGVVAIANGGTGQTTASAGFNALSPMTTAGDIIYGGASGTGTRLAAGTSTQLLHGGTTPSWSSVSLTADVSGTLPIANGGTNATTVAGARTSLGIDADHAELTSGVTYTTPSSITSSTLFKFILIGGGGGGSGINTANRGATGGGSGASCIVYLTGLAASTGYTMAIGAAGTAGATTPTAGGNGGNTTITINATTYTASGGTGGGTGSGVNGGAAGTCTNATVTAGGDQGGPSTTVNSVGSGRGGSSVAGFGGASVAVAGAGNDGTGFGSGGSGGFGATAAGGAGRQGAILVQYWN